MTQGDARRGHALDRGDEARVADQRAGQPYAFARQKQMRLGEGVHAKARRLAERAQKCAGRALAVRAGHMKHGRNCVLRIAKRGQGRAHRRQGEIFAYGKRRKLLTEQRIKALRDGVAHSAAFARGLASALRVGADSTCGAGALCAGFAAGARARRAISTSSRIAN